MDASFTVQPIHRISSCLIQSTIKVQNVFSWEFVYLSKRAFPWNQTYQTWYAVCNEIEGLSFKSCIRLCFESFRWNFYDKQPNTIQPFGLRVKSHFDNSDINLDDITPIVIPENPPWLNPKPTFNFELTKYKKS